MSVALGTISSSQSRDRWSRKQRQRYDLNSPWFREPTILTLGLPVTQRRYHMPQRSPIIFWLLLAATICVDAVAADHVAKGAYYEANLVLQALIYGDLSVVCIWSGLSREKSLWTRSASWLAGVVAISVLTIAMHGLAGRFWGWLVWTLPQTILHAAMLLMFLWLLERTPFWQRHTGVAAKWRFSLGQLLIITTVVAVLTTWFRNNYNFYMDGLLITLAPIGGRAVLGLGSAVSWSLPLHWLLRFAITVALAILLGVGCA